MSVDVAPAGLAAAVSALRALGATGFHVTIPHKVSVRAHLDRLTPAAEAIAAVNCVKRDGDELVGDNTDGRGFVSSLAPVSELSGSRLFVIGAGGAARAVAVEAALAGAAGRLRSRTARRSARRARGMVRGVGTEADIVPFDARLHVPPVWTSS